MWISRGKKRRLENDEEKRRKELENLRKVLQWTSILLFLKVVVNSLTVDLNHRQDFPKPILSGQRVFSQSQTGSNFLALTHSCRLLTLKVWDQHLLDGPGSLVVGTLLVVGEVRIALRLRECLVAWLICSKRLPF